MTTPAIAPRRLRMDERAALPTGASEGADGIITLRLCRPIPAIGGNTAAPRDCLRFRRLTGADMHKVLRSPLAAKLAFSLSVDLPWRSFVLLADGTDVSDLAKGFAIVTLLLGVEHDLPIRATLDSGGAVHLPLHYPTHDGTGTWHNDLTFKPIGLRRFNALPRQSEKAEPFFVHYSTGLALPAVRQLLDEMDATDCAAVRAVMIHMCAVALGVTSGQSRIHETIS